MGGTGYALVASRQVIDVDVCWCERDSVYRIVNPLKGCYTVSSLCVLERERQMEIITSICWLCSKKQDLVHVCISKRKTFI